jgi:hypothetical protein
VASRFPKRIFSSTVPSKRIGSWLTNPICCLNHFRSYSRRSIPSIVIDPILYSSFQYQKNCSIKTKQSKLWNQLRRTYECIVVCIEW